MTEDMTFLEMWEYPWVQNLEEIKKESKFVTDNNLNKHPPKVPLNLVLAVMKEAASRPEVMRAFGCVKLFEQIPTKESHLLTWFNEYLPESSGSSINF